MSHRLAVAFTRYGWELQSLGTNYKPGVMVSVVYVVFSMWAGLVFTRHVKPCDRVTGWKCVTLCVSDPKDKQFNVSIK